MCREEREVRSRLREQHTQRPLLGGTEKLPEGQKLKEHNGVWCETGLHRSDGQPWQGLVGKAGRAEE